MECAVGKGPRGRSAGGTGGLSARGHEVGVQGAQVEGVQEAQVEGVQGGPGGWRFVGAQVAGAQGAQGAAVQDGLGGIRVL